MISCSQDHVFLLEVNGPGWKVKTKTVEPRWKLETVGVEVRWKLQNGHVEARKWAV
jgi:hypothetical protein